MRSPATRRRRMVLVVLAATLAPAVAGAAPHTQHFDATDAEIDSRLAGLGDGADRRERRQVRALVRSSAQIARDAVDLRRDLRTARRVEGWISRRFAGDGSFEVLFDDVTSELQVESRLRLQALSDEVGARVVVRPLRRAERAVDGAAGLLARADQAPSRRKRLALLYRALGRLRSADRTLARLGLPSAADALRSPIAEIAAAGVTESSGIVFHGGAYWTHNDSAGGAVLYRASDVTFADAVALDLPGATNVDWEDVTSLDGDLIVCDAGDNDRVRDDYVLYRARFVPADTGSARLELVAAYPFAYPDGPHDCEAATVMDGHVVLVIKQHDEPDTGVYRFDTLTASGDLAPGTQNVPARIAGLTLLPGEQVTAATVYRTRGPLVVLSYFGVREYPLDALDAPPTRTVPLSVVATVQVEAACFAGDRLVITNEQRDVFAVHDFLLRE